MDQENYNFLTEKLKYSGFEDKLNANLKKEIAAGKEDFILKLPLKIEEKELEYALSFKKSQVSDRYFFNKFEAKLFGVEGTEPKTHTFYQNQGITAKEAFNLLEGRAVQKSLMDSDKEPYKAWIQLDLSKKDERNNFEVKQYHEKYGFDLEAKLKELPIVELNDDTKKGWMIKALQKGNQYPVTMDRGGREEIMFLEASPRFKSVNIYDLNMATVKTSEVKIEATKSPSENPALDQADEKDQIKKKVLKEEMKLNPNSDKRPMAKKGIKR